jgi:hypothetical protein
MKPRSLTSLTPVEKAIAKAQWQKAMTSAHLQALIGGDWPTVVDRVASILFIAGHAADIDKLPDDSPDIRILQGAVRTVVDVVDAKDLTDMQRGSLEAGLRAVERIHPLLSVHALATASIQLTLLLKTKGFVSEVDFEKVLK